MPADDRLFTRSASHRSPLLTAKDLSPGRPPDRFGPFHVRAAFGASRIGPVFAGRDSATNARVVIHTVERSNKWREFTAESDLLDAFRQLCETPCDHPNLARPLAFGVEGDTPYVVYSDLTGAGMDAVIRQDGARSVAEVLQRATQLADAIDSATGAGLHHGMLAPCDVILDGERTGVRGFGLAQALIRAGMPLKADDPYGSPQRLAGAAPTPADDIYSLAAVTLELLIGTRAASKQDLRDAHGLPERRRVQRPAPHETRVFTTIAGVDAGKLRAAFAAAFADDPGARPTTAVEFVDSFRSAVSIERGTHESAPRVVVPVTLVRDQDPDLPPAPVLEVKRAEDGPAPGLPFRQEHVEVPFSADAASPPARAMDDTPQGIWFQLRSHALAATMVVTISVTAGFGGGFVVGQRSNRSTESTDPSRRESVTRAAPARAAVEEPPRIASTAVTAPSPEAARAPIEEPTVAPVPDATVASTREQAVIPAPEKPVAKPVAVVAEQKASAPAPAARSSTGALYVLSRPSGAQVFVDDNLIGTTPLLLSDVAVGSKRLRLELSGYRIFTTSVQIEPNARVRVSAPLDQDQDGMGEQTGKLGQPVSSPLASR